MKTTRTFTLVTVSDPPGGGIDLFDLKAASEASGMHPGIIREFLRAQVVRAVHRTEAGDFYFDEGGIRRLRQIEHFRTESHFSLHVICLLLRLLDRAESAEGELRRLHKRVSWSRTTRE